MSERASENETVAVETAADQAEPVVRRRTKVQPGRMPEAADSVTAPRLPAPRRAARIRQDAPPVTATDTELPSAEEDHAPLAELASLDIDSTVEDHLALDQPTAAGVAPRRRIAGAAIAAARRATEKLVSELTKPRGAGAELPTDSPPVGKRQLFSIGKSIKPAAVLAFTRQLAAFLEAGIPVIDALEVVATQTGSAPMRAVVEDIREAILRGTSMVDAVANHPKVFPAYYRSMIVSAEYTGNLDVVLNQLASYLERDISARRQVKSALTYPTMVLIVASLAMTAMAVYVLPKFTMLYRNLGAKLPLPTRLLIAFTDFMSKAWPMLFGVVFIGIVAFVFFLGGRRGKARRDVVLMRIPLIGRLFHMISLERFCRVLSALATSGVPLPEAIAVSADSTNNTLFRRRMADVRETLIRGGGISEPMAETGLFPVAAKQMIQVGEKTGSLGRQMHKAATYYEREVGFTMKRTTELFEPMVILAVGLIVGFVAVAQVSAMYSIFGKVK